MIAYGGVAGRLRLYCRDNHEHRFEIEFLPEGQNVKIYDLEWHHVVHVYDPKAKDPNDQFRLSIDGQRQDITITRKGGVPKFSAFNDPMTLGSMDLRGDFSHSLEGSLDEVAFYTSPPTEEEVVRHYRAAGYRDRER